MKTTQLLMQLSLWTSRLALRVARGCLRRLEAKSPPPRLQCRRLPMPAQPKWRVIEHVTRQGFDYGEAQCEVCGRVWDAGVPHGMVAGLECPACAMFSGKFTRLVEASQPDRA